MRVSSRRISPWTIEGARVAHLGTPINLRAFGAWPSSRRARASLPARNCSQTGRHGVSCASSGLQPFKEKGK